MYNQILSAECPWNSGRERLPVHVGPQNTIRTSGFMDNLRAAAIFFSATYQSNSNLQFIAVNCMPAIAGIAFMLINVRVGLGWARKSFATVQPNFHTTLPGDDYALHPLAINFNPVVVQIDHEVHLSNKASQSRQTDGHSM